MGKHKYDVEDIVRIKANTTGHGFYEGEMVRIAAVEKNPAKIDSHTPSYRAEYLDRRDYWWVSEDDLEQNLEGIPFSIERVNQAMEAFEGHDDKESQLTDMLTDLMHWADDNTLDFNEHLERAQRHYYAEVEEAETPPTKGETA